MGDDDLKKMLPMLSLTALVLMYGDFREKGHGTHYWACTMIMKEIGRREVEHG